MDLLRSSVELDVLPAGVDVYLVEERANPSTDYFVHPACAGQGRRLHRCLFDDPPPEVSLANAVVVFVRYIPPLWRRKVQAERTGMAQLVFFMDDDVLDPAAWDDMPWRYRYKLYRQAARHAGWLQKVDAQLWVSTAWLQKKYAAWSPCGWSRGRCRARRARAASSITAAPRIAPRSAGCVR
ncbi:hypothetical protein WG902_20870 [Ramlibacter sp. PS3R-8]|uniref:hypothetical protein n=1 Tax=Ramlibacter sp. PS3R-8 TaxID=3133437 RepID=UPI0030ADB557